MYIDDIAKLTCTLHTEVMVKFQMIYLCCVMFALQVFGDEALADLQGKSDWVMAQRFPVISQ